MVRARRQTAQALPKIVAREPAADPIGALGERVTAGGESAGEGGFTLLGLMVVIAVINIGLAVAATSWVVIGKRAKEAELLWRGQQYVRALQCHREQTGGLPETLDDLLEADCIRALYPEPMDPDRGWRLLRQSDLGTRAGASAGAGTESSESSSVGDIYGRLGIADSTPAATTEYAWLSDQGSGSPEVGRVLDRMDAIRSAQGRLDELLGRLRQRSGVATGNGIVGVASFSADESLRIYDGESTYDAWWFVAQ